MIKTNMISSGKISFANRGMQLENDINLSNEYYKINDVAYIYKKPTPIKIVKVDYSKNVIKEAYFETPSTTDYNGIYKGRYVDFEAKETKSNTSFSLSNIHKHQVKHLIDVERHGAISFLIIRFYNLGKTYLLTTNKLNEFLSNKSRKSIPLSYFENNAYVLKTKYQPRIDYLNIIDKLYFGGNEKWWRKEKRVMP